MITVTVTYACNRIITFSGLLNHLAAHCRPMTHPIDAGDVSGIDGVLVRLGMLPCSGRGVQVSPPFGTLPVMLDGKVRENPSYSIYPLFTPFIYTCIAILTPMYTHYTCIYTIYTPNTHLNTLTISHVHL